MVQTPLTLCLVNASTSAGQQNLRRKMNIALPSQRSVPKIHPPPNQQQQQQQQNKWRKSIAASTSTDQMNFRAQPTICPEDPSSPEIANKINHRRRIHAKKLRLRCTDLSIRSHPDPSHANQAASHRRQDCTATVTATATMHDQQLAADDRANG